MEFQNNTFIDYKNSQECGFLWAWSAGFSKIRYANATWKISLDETTIFLLSTFASFIKKSMRNMKNFLYVVLCFTFFFSCVNVSEFVPISVKSKQGSLTTYHKEFKKID